MTIAKLSELTITSLGFVRCAFQGHLFRAPAGLHTVHRVRRITKSIYSLKIWMFKRQFKLTKREEKKRIADICLFTIVI